MMAARTIRPAARTDIGIEALLHWAFATECASVEFEGPGGIRLGAGYGRISNAGRMAERGALGCRIEGGGRSLPATDADVVASFVAALDVGCGGRAMALRVAELARAGRREDAMLGVVPKCVPVGWNENQHARRAKSEHVCWVPVRTRKGVGRFDSRVCPVRWDPDPAKIGAARRKYLAWWGALFDIRSRLISHGNLDQWRVTAAMPPRAPWQKGVD